VSEHKLRVAAFPMLDAWLVPAGTVLRILILKRELRDLRELPSERISAYPAISAHRAGTSKRRGLNAKRPAPERVCFGTSTVADDGARVRTIQTARAAGKSIRTIAREHGVGIGSVSRLTG
jgi:hypothetical protein